MLLIIAALCVVVGIGLLIWESIIDLREWILPNEITLAFAAMGLVFHFVMMGAILPPLEMLYGALAGGGMLLLIRTVANRVYQRDTLGLGDVKLMFAGGLWLGPYYVMIAMAAGAFIGMAIGLIFLALPHSHPDDIAPQEGDGLLHTAVPAGPGFAGGLIVGIIWMICEWPGVYMVYDKMIDDVMRFFL